MSYEATIPGTEPSADRIVGIDLGTTNSEVAALWEGRVQVLGPGERKILPSCVGLSPEGELLVGETARNQLLVYPERTVRSIKRKMGTDERVELGDRQFSPQEISSLILRELVRWAEGRLGGAIRRAAITVPAYFSDAQRSATREAGELAGLEVVRILNEPTAASLAYGGEGKDARTVMVYDLGGGTFDVSIVTMEQDVTEVLASHGNTRLGGDDFDQLLVDRLVKTFQEAHGIDLRDGHRQALARVWWSAEEAKRRLSYEPHVTVREESLLTHEGKPLHLEVELHREEFEEMIRPLVESTLASVTQALADAGKKPEDLDAVFLVGGATRTPLVSRVLEQRCGIAPRQDIHPDLCVALGAGVLASRLAGHQVERVLVDVSPYSFGPSYLGERGGCEYPHCYRPIIRRNTPLPVTRTESYFTASPHQSVVQLQIYQGDDEDALKNVLVGDFRIEKLTSQDEPNEVLCRMALDLDGLLHVTAIEKQSGKSKHVAIEGALATKSAAELAAARRRMEELYSARGEDAGEAAGSFESEGLDTVELGDAAPAAETSAGGDAWSAQAEEAKGLVERSRGLIERIHDEDREEMAELIDEIEEAVAARDAETLKAATGELRELLFFVEGR